VHNVGPAMGPVEKKREKLADWAGFWGKPGLSPWLILAIGNFFLFYKLFLNRELF
jgi:hypothetical protein